MEKITNNNCVSMCFLLVHIYIVGSAKVAPQQFSEHQNLLCGIFHVPWVAHSSQLPPAWSCSAALERETAYDVNQHLSGIVS